jgi:hypothetical protein
MLDSDPEEDLVQPPRCPPRPLSPSPPPPVRRQSPPSREPPKQPMEWGTLLTRMKPDAPKAKKAPRRAQQKAPTPPPAATGKRAWLSREDWLAKKRMEDVGRGGFDIRVHGYWRTKRGLILRCPDGRELPATGVDAFGAFDA